MSPQRSSVWAIAQKKSGGKTDIRKEVEGVYPGRRWVGIALGRSMRLLCSKGDERICKSVEGESPNTKKGV